MSRWKHLQIRQNLEQKYFEEHLHPLEVAWPSLVKKIVSKLNQPFDHPSLKIMILHKQY
jgi:hypothetical protein